MQFLSKRTPCASLTTLAPGVNARTATCGCSSLPRSRGSLSAEHFLKQGYAVLFVHRSGHTWPTPLLCVTDSLGATGSLLPFTGRHQGVVNNLFDHLSLAEGGSEPQTLQLSAPGLEDTLAAYTEAKTVICVERMYTSNADSEYSVVSSSVLSLKRSEIICPFIYSFTLPAPFPNHLGRYLLRSSAIASKSAGRSVCIYLAAAVSDFYVADKDMPEHKMQVGFAQVKCTCGLTEKHVPTAVFRGASRNLSNRHS